MPKFLIKLVCDIGNEIYCNFIENKKILQKVEKKKKKTIMQILLVNFKYQ